MFGWLKRMVRAAANHFRRTTGRRFETADIARVPCFRAEAALQGS